MGEIVNEKNIKFNIFTHNFQWFLNEISYKNFNAIDLNFITIISITNNIYNTYFHKSQPQAKQFCEKFNCTDGKCFI